MFWSRAFLTAHNEAFEANDQCCGSIPNTLNLDPDPECWPNMDADPDPGLCLQF